MELEELKSIWRSNEPVFLPKGEAEIAAMLTRKSQSIVDKLKRSVRFELAITSVMSVGLLVYVLYLPSGALKWTSLSVILMCLAYSIYYVKKLMLLNRFDPSQDNIRNNLVSLVVTLTTYLKYYKRSYTTLYPIYFALGLLFGALQHGAHRFFENLARPATMLYLLLMAGLFYFLSTRFTNWYVKKLYGEHLEKLRDLLDDLRNTH